MGEIRECPFCGDTGGALFQPDPVTESGTWAVGCGDCDASGDTHWSGTDKANAQARAIAAWNHRPTEDALREEVERLRAVVEQIAEPQGRLTGESAEGFQMLAQDALRPKGGEANG